MNEHAAADGLASPRRYWAVAAVALAISMTVLDGTMVSVALPAIARDMEATAAASVWVVKAYQLAVICSLLPLASLGDSIGYRRIFLGGLLLFIVASLACATADSLAMLTAFRVAQGLGAAGIMSVNLALVRYIYPRAMLGRGIGINIFVVGVSASAGPAVAGAILLVGDWHWLFAIHVPLGLLAVALGLGTLPPSARSAHRFDFVSALLNALTFALLILAIDSISRAATPWPPLVLAAGAMVVGTVLVRRQLTLPSPLLPVDLLRIPIFALSIVTSMCSFSAQMLAFVALPFYFQDVMGRSPVETGLLMTPWALLTAAASPLAGRLADHYAAGILGGIGLLTLCLGLLLLAALPAEAATLDIAWRMGLCGAGFSLFQAPNNRALVAAAPRERIGGASGMLGTARLSGQIFGAALAALVFSLVGTGGSVTALLLAAGFAGSAAVVSALRLRVRS